jgi:hypothetical protein
MMRRASAIAFAFLFAACSSSTPTAAPGTGATGATSGVPGSTGTAPGGASPASSATGTDAPATLRVAFGDPVELPRTSQWGTALFASADGAHVMIPGRRVDKPGAVSQPHLAVRGADGGWTDMAFDVDKTIDQPSGYPKDNSGLRISGIAFGASGMVAIAWNEFATSSDFPTHRSNAWASSDGVTWTRSDLGDVVGNVEFTAQVVAATTDGFLVVGQTTNKTSTEAASLLVLSSSDGLRWKRLAQIKGTWAVNASAIRELGGQLVIAGTEFACDDDFDTFGGFIEGRQIRLWSSSDHGATWASVNVDASGITSAKPMPTSAAGCPDMTTNDSRAILSRDFLTRGSVLGFAGDRLVLAAPDLSSTATTADLVTWTTATVPGGAPTGTLIADPHQVIRALGALPSGLAVVSLELPRDAKDQQQSSATLKAIVWRSEDGTTWTRVPIDAHPVEADGNAWKLYVEPSGELIFVTYSPSPYDTTGDPGWTHVRTAMPTP